MPQYYYIAKTLPFYRNEDEILCDSTGYPGRYLWSEVLIYAEQFYKRYGKNATISIIEV